MVKTAEESGGTALDKQQKMNSFMDGCALSTVYKILHTSEARKGKVVKSVV